MEKGKAAVVKLSSQFLLDLEDVYQHGPEIFVPHQAEFYENEIFDSFQHEPELRL